MILRGELALGQPLPEVDLCRRLGVSRNPLREALHKLAGERLVVLRPNHGAEVARPSRAELKEIAEACRLFEGHLLRLAGPALTRAQLERAADLAGCLEGEDDLLAWARTNWEFHLALYSAAGRPFLLEWLGDLRARADLALRVLLESKERRTALNREHRGILESLQRRRFAQAAKLLDDHLGGAGETLLELI
jgi:DNA-binding GntR family transcriptional regulator